MHAVKPGIIHRRHFMAGVAAATLLALPGCTTTGGFGGLSLVEVIRRLLGRASSQALARLAAPGGFYDNQLARLDLPDVFGSRGGVLQGILTSAVFKDKLTKSLNHVAEDGAERAAPVVAEAVRTIGIENAAALIKGRPTEASEFLRTAMGGRLIETMAPALGDGLRLSNDPVVGQALAALTGVDIAGAARSLAEKADNAIWAEIGREEASIRADPRATGDPLLIAAFSVV